MIEHSIDIRFRELLENHIPAAASLEKSIFDEQAAPLEKTIVLFGAGNVGRKALTGLRKLGITVLAFADNNPKLWNTHVDELLVLSPADAAQKFGKTAVFVTTMWNPSSQYNELAQTLAELGCLRIVSFLHLFRKYPETFLPHFCIDSANGLLTHASEIRSAMSLMADEVSRHEYLAQLTWLVNPIEMSGQFPEPAAGPKDFPLELFALSPSEHFVDCGAFDGDTLMDFLRLSNGTFSHILAIEPDPGNFSKLAGKIASLDPETRNKIKLHQGAVGARRETLQFDAQGSLASSFNETGSVSVSVVPIDEISDPNRLPTFIKMDIEGAEIDALTGGKNIIESASPILAVCVYHTQDHLWRIPLLVQSMSDRYKFYLRRYSAQFWDLVCFCVPVDRLKIQ